MFYESSADDTIELHCDLQVPDLALPGGQVSRQHVAHNYRFSYYRGHGDRLMIDNHALLTALEARVIACTQHRGEAPLKQLAELCSVSIPTIRKTIETLRVRGVLVTRSHYIDHFRLGFTGGRIYISIADCSAEQREQIVAYIQELHFVTYMAQVSGPFDYLIVFMAESFREVQALLRELSRSHGVNFRRRVLTITAGYRAYSRKHLCPSIRDLPAFHMDADVSPIDIDETDRRILRALSEHEYQTHREIARRLATPHTLVQRRIARLTDQGVILGVFYQFNTWAMGFKLYRILISLRDLRRENFDTMHSIAAEHPHIIRCTETIGPWDFEIDVEVADESACKQTLQDIGATLGDAILGTQTMEIVRHLHFKSFPFPVQQTPPDNR